MQRFVKQCVHLGTGQIGIAGFFAAAIFVERVAAVAASGAVDCHETLCDVGV